MRYFERFTSMDKVRSKQLEQYTGTIALTGSDFIHGRDQEYMTSIHTKQAVHVLRRIMPQIQTGVVAVRALVPETRTDDRPLMSPDGAERLAAELNNQGASVTLYDEPLRMPVNSSGITGASAKLEEAVKMFKQSDEAADAPLGFIGVANPHEADLAFRHLHGPHLMGGSVMTLEGDPANIANGFWMRRS